MGTTSEKLTYLNTTKTLIKDNLNLGGANISNEPFRVYSTKLIDIYKDFLANGTDTLWTNWEKVNASGTLLSLSPTIKGKMNIDLKGNTSQEGTPSPDYPQPIQVVSGNNSIKVEGKNLIGTLNQGGINLGGGGTDTSATNRVRTNFIEVDVNSQYRFTNYGSIINQFGIGFYDENNNFISAYASGGWATFPATITMVQNTKYIKVMFRNTSNVDITPDLDYKIQIEKGNQATTYEAYQSQTLPINLGTIELCKIGTYQDYIYKSSGKWYVHKEIVKHTLDGTDLSATSIASYTPNIRASIPANDVILSTTGRNEVYSNKYLGSTKAITSPATNPYTICRHQDGLLFVVLPSSVASDTTQANTFFSNNPANVYYQLATPTNTEITDTTLIEQLDNLEEAYSYSQQTNISQTNNDMPFILDVVALKEIG